MGKMHWFWYAFRKKKFLVMVLDWDRSRTTARGCYDDTPSRFYLGFLAYRRDRWGGVRTSCSRKIKDASQRPHLGGIVLALHKQFC